MLDMPVRLEGGARLKFEEALLREGVEVGAKQCVEQGQHHSSASPRLPAVFVALLVLATRFGVAACLMPDCARGHA